MQRYTQSWKREIPRKELVVRILGWLSIGNGGSRSPDEDKHVWVEFFKHVNLFISHDLRTRFKPTKPNLTHELKSNPHPEYDPQTCKVVSGFGLYVLGLNNMTHIFISVMSGLIFLTVNLLTCTQPTHQPERERLDCIHGGHFPILGLKGNSGLFFFYKSNGSDFRVFFIKRPIDHLQVNFYGTKHDEY